MKKWTRVLWKNVPKGRNGGTSTKVEYFSGPVEDWHDSEFLNIRREAITRNTRIHKSYLQADPDNGFCRAQGGQCYKISDVRQNLQDSVKCPVTGCKRVFRNKWAYEAHYQAVHQNQDSDRKSD